ncbi:MAG TPA: DUF4215 domain-containing protein [Kofleriaceae bacterium]|nr:DUF4215 domain-containing protein [Kofleriaceae bacterium]
MTSITRWLVLASLALAACARPPDSQECKTGITCPEGTKCAAAQPICITNDCGDGIQQSTEKCDDGNVIDGDGCAKDCLSKEVCGDNVINSAAGEICDDGNDDGGDGCSADCKSVETCGNGIRDITEVCDDGNTVPGDGCSGNCKSTEVCGNGIVDINEKCDDAGAPGNCNDDCQGGQGCGDGAIDKGADGLPIEECDDGNMFNDDDCVQCHIARCGDHELKTKGLNPEECDPAVNFGETFDCNMDCTNARCGDGKLNLTRGEQCDDTNTVDEDACKNDCTINYCGDGVPGGPNEACDTAGPSMTCDFDCSMPGCGDGFVNLAFGEQCDSSGVNTATCDANCTIPICGDGTVNMAAGEDCDDMNNVNTDACRNDCKFNICGDGFTDSTDEMCDDGNTMPETLCSYGTQTCQLCSANCQMVENLIGHFCGDTNMDSPFEVCDDGNSATESTCPYNSPNGICTVCAGDCKSTPAKTGPYCGDGNVQMTFGEVCDDHNNMACGRCDATCHVQASSAATGYIVAVSHTEFVDKNTITINDGFTHVETYEFDDDNMITSGNIKIAIGNMDTAADMAAKITSAINRGNGTLLIDAASTGALVTLTHQRKSSLGNVQIMAMVGNANFSYSGMSGGTGGNCDPGIGCNSDDDCKSGNCMNNNQCQ